MYYGEAATDKTCHSFLLIVVWLLLALCKRYVVKDSNYPFITSYVVLEQISLYMQLYPPIAGLHNTQGKLYMADEQRYSV